MLFNIKLFNAIFFIAVFVWSEIAVALPASAEPAPHQKDWPPKFQQYPAAGAFKGKLTFDQIGCGRKFRDAIKDALKTEGINLAGDSVLVEWGCGSYCQSHAIVYGPTGKVNCELPTTAVGATSRKDSNLIILNPPEMLKTMPDSDRLGITTQYFLWSNGKLTELSKPKTGHHKNARNSDSMHPSRRERH